MAELEKVIAILERCWKHECDKCDWRDGASGFPWSCPRRNQAEKAALELLKAQMPRVMAFWEVLEADDWMWVEHWGDHGWLLIVNKDEVVYDLIFWNDTTSDKAEEYGKTWRCWTSRPTPDQMANTPWEEKENA